MKFRKGISLIILAITIIVTIIIAGAVVMTMQDTNVIDMANKAKKEYSKAEVQDIIETAKVELTMQQIDEKTDAELKEYLDEKIKDTGYSVIVKNQKITVVNEEETKLYAEKIDTYRAGFEMNKAETICTLGGRIFTKQYENKAIAAYYTYVASNGSCWNGPLLVGETRDSVSYYYVSTTNLCTSRHSFTYNGKTYFCSECGNFMTAAGSSNGDTSDKNRYHLAGTYTTVEAAAIALLDIYFADSTDIK